MRRFVFVCSVSSSLQPESEENVQQRETTRSLCPAPQTRYPSIESRSRLVMTTFITVTAKPEHTSKSCYIQGRHGAATERLTNDSCDCIMRSYHLSQCALKDDIAWSVKQLDMNGAISAQNARVNGRHTDDIFDDVLRIRFKLVPRLQPTTLSSQIKPLAPPCSSVILALPNQSDLEHTSSWRLLSAVISTK